MIPIDFFRTYFPAAKENEKKTGVPWQVTLAQAALESAWGKHAPGNNFFGIKADPTWTGRVQTLRTREVINGVGVFVQARFRAYDSPEESFADHANFLRRWPRYSKAFATLDPYAFARIVAAAGYATDPNYGNVLAGNPLIPTDRGLIGVIEDIERKERQSKRTTIVETRPTLWQIIKRSFGW